MIIWLRWFLGLARNQHFQLEKYKNKGAEKQRVNEVLRNMDEIWISMCFQQIKNEERIKLAGVLSLIVLRGVLFSRV